MPQGFRESSLRIICLILVIAGIAISWSALWFSTYTGINTSGPMYLYNGFLFFQWTEHGNPDPSTIDVGVLVISKCGNRIAPLSVQDTAEFSLKLRGVGPLALGTAGLLELWFRRWRRKRNNEKRRVFILSRTPPDTAR